VGTPVAPTVSALVAPLTDVEDRGVYGIDGAGGPSFVNWRSHIRDAAALAAALRARLDPTRPPHVGVLAGNTPALNLYGSLGFDEVYPYTYRRAPGWGRG